jgi:quinol-cytochrome oxidoreductase complex cytochrome b subunit
MSDANETPRSSGWDGPAWGQPVATSTRPSPAQEVQEVSEYKYNDKKMMIVSIIGLFIGGIFVLPFTLYFSAKSRRLGDRRPMMTAAFTISLVGLILIGICLAISFLFARL